MKITFLFVTLFQVLQAEAPEEICGYVGETVTLPSGGKSSPSTIVWSIFSNTTAIARYQYRNTYTKLFPQYWNRLSLNESTGDLTIRNLVMQDALVYKLELLNKEGASERMINLRVRQQLPVPTIEGLSSTLRDGSQLVRLKCSSGEQDVVYTWQVRHPRLISSISRSGELFAVYNSSQGAATFICTTTRDKKSTSTSHRDLIEEQPSPGPLPHYRKRHLIYVVVFMAGVVVSMATMAAYLYCKKEYNQRKTETAASSP